MILKRTSVILMLIFGWGGQIFAQETPTPDLPTLCPSVSESAMPAPDAKKVLTTFTVIADMARNVACDKLQVESLTRVGSEIHGYEPTPSDLKKAQEADLVLYNGLNLELWFEQFMGAVSDVPSVVLTDGIEPLLIAEGAYKDLPNPHAWMSPQMALVYVDNIRKAFIELDPANESAYNANAEAYSAHIQDIDGFLRENLAQIPDAQRYLVSCEGAFTYLAKDYDMQELYMWAINADQQGTPRQVAKLVDAVKQNQVPAVFCETTVNNDPMMTVAESTGARFGGALFVDSLSEADGPVPTYLDLLRYDITIIVSGLLGE
jgi:ABC-type Zn uptake system ZnuABC Zn-binding protein ZnuA